MCWLVWWTLAIVVTATFVIVLFERKKPKPISFKPVGFRDVWWCYRVNEPVITIYEGTMATEWHPVCSICKQRLDDPAIEDHVFMFHINKNLEWLDHQ